MSEWLAMGGYGFYVWSSYGALALAIAVELWLLRRRRAQARALVRQSIEEESA
ncbi:heme exporter protein CcmD [Quisquiliibacterium transsilvanicum]|uniref:Heme exporter protein D n=1 Tax=Quisquiliibacterium transsilvanicum TaxID=1549638 RepID=A0A7W8HHT4_9BURK|nr:heme exporter protein CcmD [Quisquiliibacterium transsilvanicum]MBB5272314.1 heme exporter protein D [Quisquiliibacterium transsilvanicum]